MSTIDICICTYRRTSLEDTLRSIARQSGMQADLRVIIADNDGSPSARSLVEQIAIGFPFHITYCHAPSKNISIARNACLSASTAQFIVFIDDDLIAAPTWISSLEKARSQTGADAIFGQVQAIYPENAPHWLQQTKPHSIKPSFNNGVLKTGYSCNVMIKGGLAREHAFDQRFGVSGGEDTDYFYRIWKKGAHYAFAQDATVIERIAPTRLTIKWLFKRSFRSGQTYARLVKDQHSFSYALISAMIKAVYCFGTAVLMSPWPSKSRLSTIRGALHLGVMLSLIGVRDLKIYK